jgi:hypothetical protein
MNRTYRGWKIVKFSGVQIGYPITQSNGVETRKTARKIGGYLFINPEDGYERHADTLQEAKDRIDMYLAD